MTYDIENMLGEDLVSLAKDIERELAARHVVAPTATKALQSLVSTIDATGGLQKDDGPTGYAPVGDPDWPGLATAYLEACVVLGREPLTAESEDEGTEDDEDDACDADDPRAL